MMNVQNIINNKHLLVTDVYVMLRIMFEIGLSTVIIDNTNPEDSA